MRASDCATVCFSALAAAALAAGPAHAAMLVLRTSGAAVAERYPHGAILPAGPVTLAPGEWLLVVSEGRTTKLEGPTRATAKAAKPADVPLLGKVADAFRRIEARPPELGVVRGGTQVAPTDAWSVSVELNAVVCVRAGKTPNLWRSDPGGVSRASLEDRSSGDRRFFTWPAGQSEVPWPRELRIRDGDYLFRDATSRSRVLQVRVLPKGTGLGQLAAMSDLNCLDQLDRLAAVEVPAPPLDRAP